MSGYSNVMGLIDYLSKGGRAGAADGATLGGTSIAPIGGEVNPNLLGTKPIGYMEQKYGDVSYPTARGGAPGENLESSAASQFRAWLGDKANEIAERGFGGRAGQVNGATLGGVNISPSENYRPGIDVHPLAALQAGNRLATNVGTNPQGLGPPSMYDDNYGASFTPAQSTGLEPGVVPDSMVTLPRSNLEWAGFPTTSDSRGWMKSNYGAYGDSATDDETAADDNMLAMALDPIAGRGLPPIHGKYAERFHAGPSKGSKFVSGVLGIPQSRGDNYANLYAADYFGRKPGEGGWVDTAEVGNFNPLDHANPVSVSGPAGGWSLGELFGGTAEQDSNDDRGGGGWFGGLFGG